LKNSKRVISRKKTIPVRVGKIIVGGGFPISVQTMWKEPLEKIDNSLIERINTLSNLGCDILRFSVPRIETAEILGNLAGVVSLPLVADIHFDYRIALRILDFPISKLRINPGNIENPQKIEEIIKKAMDRDVSIRVGINGGSLPRKFKAEKSKAIAMIKAAEEEMEILEKHNFKNVIFSLKSSDIQSTIDANLEFSERYNYPLHIGLTEAGPLPQGTVKSVLAIGEILKSGVGDTIRVSLSSKPEDEIIVGKEIIRSIIYKGKGINLVSCPMCGRATFDVHGFLDKIGKYVNSLNNKDLTIAVMGCIVNGPGEAKTADIGITGAGNSVIIFKKGKMVKKTTAKNAVEDFIDELRRG